MTGGAAWAGVPSAGVAAPVGAAVIGFAIGMVGSTAFGCWVTCFGAALGAGCGFGGGRGLSGGGAPGFVGADLAAANFSRTKMASVKNASFLPIPTPVQLLQYSRYKYFANALPDTRKRRY